MYVGMRWSADTLRQSIWLLGNRKSFVGWSHANFLFSGRIGKSSDEKCEMNHERLKHKHGMIHAIRELPPINRCGGNFYDD